MAAARSAPVPRPLDSLLSYRLHLANKIADRSTSDAYAQEFGLPVGEARCLAAIGQFAPLSVIELATRANLDKAQASRAAQGLVERGLVAKTASATDARGVVLQPTASGRRLWARVMASLAQRNDEVFGGLNKGEQKQLATLLDKVIGNGRG